MKTLVTFLFLLLEVASSSWGVIVISSEPNYQFSPMLAFGPDTFLVVWEDWRNGQQSERTDLYAARVTLQSEVLEPHGFPIALKKDFVKFVNQPVWDGVNWFVPWSADSAYTGCWRVMGARVTRGGVVLEPEGIPLLNYYAAQLYPAASFDGQYYFLTWYDTRQTGNGPGLYGTRLTRDLVALDPDGIFLWGGRNGSPALSFDGQNYCVVWDEWSNRICPRVYAGRVSPGGGVLDTIPIEVFPRGNTDGVEAPDIAFGGGVHFIVASRESLIPPFGKYPIDIWGARITPQGVLLDSNAVWVSTIVLPRQNTFRFPVDLDFNGRFFQSVWYTDTPSLQQVIEGARVEPSGRVLDTVQVRVVREDTGVQEDPGIAYGRDGKFLLVWGNRVPYVADVYGCFVDTSGRQVVGVAEQTSSVNPVPLRFSLAQNAPNPWASGTRISYSLPQEAQVVLRVYNPVGQLVRTLVDCNESAGNKQVAWDGRDDGGRRVPTGVYFYRLQAGAFSDTKKMVVIR